MNEFEAIDQCLLNHYDQLTAAVELFLESPTPAFLELLQKTHSDLVDFKSKMYPPNEN